MITRRVLLAVGTVSLATPLTGCSIDSLDSLRPAKKVPKPDHDARLLAQVRADLERARGLAAGTPFATLHAAQLAALDGPSPTASPTASSTASPTAPAGPPATAEQVRASEAALQRRLLSACQQAHSGRLATVFASMAAGTAQALA